MSREQLYSHLSNTNWKDWDTTTLQSLAAYLIAQPDPVNIPLRNRVNWAPQPRQAALLKAAGVLDYYLDDGPIKEPVTKLIGYGGAAGGGKTDSALMLARIICDAFKNANVTIFRRTYPELDGPDGIVMRSLELFSQDGKYNKSEHRWSFSPNNSHIYFRYVENEIDVTRYQGHAFHVLIIDEATHFTWQIIDYLITRNRTTVPGLVPFAVMLSNPGNVGHAWYSSLFDVHDTSGGEMGPHEQIKHRLTPNDKWDDVYFIPARLEDNQILMTLDPDYERKLEERNPDLVEGLRWGNWLIFAGQAFRIWRRMDHVIEPFEIPTWWPKWRAVDWGHAKPFCCLWFTQDPDTERVIAYKELYSDGLTDQQQARMIRMMTAPSENIVMTYADPSMWASKNRENVEYTTADEYRSEGVPLTRADNDRLSGKRKIDRLLVKLLDGKPGFQATSNCENLIRMMPLLVRDRTNPEDIDTTQEDHAYDTLRYGLTNVRPPLPRQEEQTLENQSPADRLRSIL